MKKLFFILLCATTTLLVSSCATIIGGAKYNAKVQVPNHPNATIIVNGQYKGTGEANFPVQRRHANELSITIEEENYEPETTVFTNKTFRGWAFVGTIVGWTGYITNPFILLPWGVVVDAATGAWWKPDITEKGVSKIDYDNFLYTINYNAIPKKQIDIDNINTEKEQIPVNQQSKADKLRELKKLLDDGILTQEEYEKEKAKILNSDI